MPTTTTNHEHEHFPCDCHRPEYAYTDSLCPMCEEVLEREREARRGEGAHENWMKTEPEDQQPKTRRSEVDAELYGDEGRDLGEW